MLQVYWLMFLSLMDGADLIEIETLNRLQLIDLLFNISTTTINNMTR